MTLESDTWKKTGTEKRLKITALHMRHGGLSEVAVGPASEGVCCLWQENTSSWSCCGLVHPLMCKTDRLSVLSLVFSSSLSFHLCSLKFPLYLNLPGDVITIFSHFEYLLCEFVLSYIPRCIPATNACCDADVAFLCCSILKTNQPKVCES